jgi:hypothetical protein
MTMPEAAMDEYCPSIPPIRQIWGTRQVPIVDSEAVPKAVNETTHPDLRGGVTLADAGESYGRFEIDDELRLPRGS